MSIKDRVSKYINAHRDAGDEALALVVALGKALLDRRITQTEAREIVLKAQALIAALQAAPEED